MIFTRIVNRSVRLHHLVRTKGYRMTIVVLRLRVICLKLSVDDGSTLVGCH